MFIYLVFTRMSGESYCRRLMSLLLRLSDVFRALINSLVYWFISERGARQMFIIIITIPSYQRFSLPKSGIGQNIDLHALPTAGNSSSYMRCRFIQFHPPSPHPPKPYSNEKWRVPDQIRVGQLVFKTCSSESDFYFSFNWLCLGCASTVCTDCPFKQDMSWALNQTFTREPINWVSAIFNFRGWLVTEMSSIDQSKFYALWLQKGGKRFEFR